MPFIYRYCKLCQTYFGLSAEAHTHTHTNDECENAHTWNISGSHIANIGPNWRCLFFQITEYTFCYTTSTDINDSSTYSPSRAAMSDTFDTFMDLTISYKCHWASYGFCVSNISTSENVFFSQKFSVEAQVKWLRQNLESYLWGQKGWIIKSMCCDSWKYEKHRSTWFFVASKLFEIRKVYHR